MLGYVGFMISFHGSVTSQQNLSQADKGLLLFDVFTALSNLNGKEIGRRYVELATQDPKSPDFEMGADYGSFCAFASVGKMTPEGQPHFDQARKAAAAQGKSDDLGVIAGIMIQNLYFEVLRSRFWAD